MAGDVPADGTCPGCGTPFVTLEINMRVVCTCCGGTGFYDPLFGPREPCGTCKGEKFVDAPKAKPAVSSQFNDNEKLSADIRPMGARKYIDAATTADERRLRKSVAFGVMYGGNAGEVSRKLRENMERKPLTPEENILVEYAQRDIERTQALADFYRADLGEPHVPTPRNNEADALAYNAALGWMPVNQHSVLGDVKEMTPEGIRTMTPDDYMEYRRILGFDKNNVPFSRRQSESRMHRVGHKVGEIGLTFTIPNEMQDKIEKVDTLLRSFVVQLKDLGVKVESATAAVDKLRVALDIDTKINSTWTRKPLPNYQHIPDYVFKPMFEASIIEDESSVLKDMDFKRIEAMMERKRAIMQLSTFKAMTEVPPLYYDPETGAIARKP